MGLDIETIVIIYYRYLLIIALIILSPSFEGLLFKVSTRLRRK